MIATTLTNIAHQINGELIGKDISIEHVFTDSRVQNPCGLFVALKGPHFDAHQFVNEVLNAGATAAVVEQKIDIDYPQIVVKNTRLALAEIARFNRHQSNAKYIAITGSSGKTTVKEMIASILQQTTQVFATQGNLNNDIGVPLTLLQIDSNIQFGVIELGANHAGEVAFTADITQPDVALVNNISAAHLQGFGDLNGVARAKAEIYAALSKDGIAIVNNDDSFSDFFKQKIVGKMITFSVEDDADVYVTNIRIEKDQSTRFSINYLQQQQTINLPLIGLHNISNALAAAACCIASGISLKNIAIGLSQTPQVAGRLIVHDLNNGCRIIDDSYNANLASMIAAINLLKNYPAPRILVLGDMAELGEQGRQYHEQIGDYARESHIEKLYSVGVLTQFSQLSFEKNDAEELKNNNIDDSKISVSDHFTDQKELIRALKKEAIAGATILIKGSRSAKMENIVTALLNHSTDQTVMVDDTEKMDKRAASLMGDC